MHAYYTLTKTEQEELSERLARGEIIQSQRQARRDTFDITLSTGTRVAGAYGWDADNPTEWYMSVDHQN